MNTLILNKLRLYGKLMRLDKPIGILLLLWPTLWAVCIVSAQYQYTLSVYSRPFIELLIVFITGTVLMRSAGCAMNDIADRRFDLQVKRTAKRVITTGQVSVFEAIMVASICIVCSGILAIVYLNKLAILLCIPALIIAAIYPLFKRFFAIPQAILGVAFGFGILIADAAIENTVSFQVILLFIANFFWVLSYDTIYAMSDRPDDLKLGLNTSAIFFGRYDIWAITISYIGFYVLLGTVFSLNTVNWLVWVVFFIVCIYTIKLIKRLFYAKKNLAIDSDDFRELCTHIFFKNSHIGLLIGFGLILDKIIK